MKKLFTYAMLLMSVCLFTACASDSDDEEVETKESSAAEIQFLGAWKSPSGLPIIFMTNGKMLHFPTKKYKDNQRYNIVQGHWNYNDQTKILATDFESYQWQITLISDDSWSGIQLWDNKSGTVNRISHYNNMYNSDYKYVTGLLLSHTTWEHEGLEINFELDYSYIPKAKTKGGSEIRLEDIFEDKLNDVLRIGKGTVYEIHHPYDSENIYLKYPSGIMYHPKK